jgi:hypothetical protein
LCYAAPREALPIQFVCKFWPLFLAAAHAASSIFFASHDAGGGVIRPGPGRSLIQIMVQIEGKA